MTDIPLIHERGALDASAPAADVVATSGAALRLTGIDRSFVGVRALTEVDFDVRPGEVHALVGENGAGKSTLMAVASGALVPDRGSVEIAGRLLPTASPEAARQLGLGIVRQHPALLPDLTVAENFYLGGATDGLPFRAAAQAQADLDTWEMGISARSRVADLTVEQRFVVEIARALALRPTVLLLDEPTEHLSREEVQRLFARVRELTAAGTAVVYISHRIPEVKRIADRITVLRDGHVRGTFSADAIDEQQIVELVIGRSLDAVMPPKAATTGTLTDTTVLRADGLTGPGFADIDLEVRAGEIVGLAGVQGNGQTQLVRALAGLTASQGTVEVAGRSVARGSSRAAARAGVVYAPADRHEEGIFGVLPVSTNIVMSTIRSVSRVGIVSHQRADAAAREEVDRFSVKTASVHTPVRSLSGGNQQKVVLARVLRSQPRVILAEEPTQGVDAGARVDIYRLLRQAASDGAAVLLLSSDGVELEGLCDRVLIMSRGSVVAELDGDDVAEEAITRAALTATTTRNRLRARAERRGRLAAWAAGDHSPAAVLALAIAIVALVVGTRNDAYLSAFNVNNLLFMAAPLILVGAAQQVVVLGAGIDLSVGPLMGLLVVVSSFWVVDGGNLYTGLLVMLAAAVGVGFFNGVVTAYCGVSPVVATLAMFMALQGIFLSLREVPDGIIAAGVAEQVNTRVGIVPVAVLLAVAVALALQAAVRHTRWGIALRAVGSDAEAAAEVGVRVRRVRATSYVASSLLVVPAAIVVMALIGIGDGRPSVAYTLSSITVVVLAGSSVFGGRGSFIGVVVASLLMQQLLNASPFLGLSQAWSYLMPGLITVLAAVCYARLRQNRRVG